MSKYFGNKKNKQIFNGIIPRYERKGKVVKLATFDNTSFTTKAVENINNFKLLIWQCTFSNTNRVLGSITGTPSQLQQCNMSDSTWQATFPGNVSEYMCELYYKNDTELIGRREKYSRGILYGIRK